MAEAIVDTSITVTRFFCHQCSVEIEHLLPDYTCPRCSTGFIEELEDNRSNNRSELDMQDISDIEVDVTSYDDIEIPFSILRSSGQNRSGSRDNQSASRNSRNQQQGLPPQFENMIQNIFLNLSSIGFSIQQDQGSQPLFFMSNLMGNPGDYVWGQNGLDSIVTQLLNQMDGTGPPPLTEKQINEIPTVIISQSHIDSKLQCSVCWEDFLLDESVRQLPCQHQFHDSCIVPWLKLHGTCPICRQSLGDQTTSEANQDTVGPSLAALFRAANESNSENNETP